MPTPPLLALIPNQDTMQDLQRVVKILFCSQYIIHLKILKGWNGKVRKAVLWLVEWSRCVSLSLEVKEGDSLGPHCIDNTWPILSGELDRYSLDFIKIQKWCLIPFLVWGRGGAVSRQKAVLWTVCHNSRTKIGRPGRELLSHGWW